MLRMCRRNTIHRKSAALLLGVYRFATLLWWFAGPEHDGFCSGVLSFARFLVPTSVVLTSLTRTQSLPRDPVVPSVPEARGSCV